MGYSPLMAALKKAQKNGTDVATQLKAETPKPVKHTSSYQNSNTRNNQPAGSRGRASGIDRNKNNSIPSGTPTAPYNFVKLNDVVVAAPFGEKVRAGEEQQTYKQFLLNDEVKYSGYFDVEVENITPLFINNGKDKFFSDGEQYLIPGSSLRGTIKNYFKIITNGTMRIGDDGDVTDKYLYYRTFASPYKPLREAYKAEMTTRDPGKGIDLPSSKAGFLVREGKQYFICPATFKRIKDEREAQRRNAKIEWNNTSVNLYSGKMSSKKHYYRFTGAQWQVKLEIPEKVLIGYYTDKNAKGLRLLDVNGRPNTSLGKKGWDSNCKILKGAAAYDFVVPCFYVADGKNVKHFGATLLYRIPYKKSIGEHIPVQLQSSVVDLTEAIFGNKDNWSSRVFFENLYLAAETKAKFLEQAKVIPLLGANPTSFQNYLETQNGQAAFWNASTHIRGYKLYWHKTCDWRKNENDRKQNENITKAITPLQPNHIFTGRVRFENLSREELGALAQVLSLGDNKKSAYKLGMGKSIGMGSVHIKSTLYIQTEAYYTSLFDADGFASGLQREDKQQYITAFTEYMQKTLAPASLQLYNERMQEVALIMDESYLAQQDWASKTAYMNINDKKDKDLANHRVPLPSIKDVVKK